MSLEAYKVVVNGTETTLLLTRDDAKSRGLVQEKAPAEKKAPAPKNKAVTAPNKSGDK